jgi:hypothetical protein
LPVGRPRRGTRKSLILLLAGTTVVLLCFGVGWGTDAGLLTMGSGRTEVTPTKAAGKDQAAQREAADEATARKVAAANAADAQAAARRAAEAKAALRKPVVAVPRLVGHRLDDAMDLAGDAGLTAVTVCRTPAGDTPLWWPNWRVTGQDVPAGTRVVADRPVCLAAAK